MSEIWLTIFNLIAATGVGVWAVFKVIIPQIVNARLESEREEREARLRSLHDEREHRQGLEERELQLTEAQRQANQRLTLTLNQNIIGTLERSMAESTMANETIRDKFYQRLDDGLSHIYGELDGLRLEMRRMDANYNDLARDQHLYQMENQARLETRVDELAAVVEQLRVLFEATYGVKLGWGAGEHGGEEENQFRMMKDE